MNHDVFISYSSKNSTAAQAICHELEDSGIKCWMAPRDIPVGSKYASVINRAIIHCKVIVLVFSDYSARSPWVESEINIAFSNRKVIIPYKIDKTNFEDFDEFYLMLNNRHWIEAYPDYKTRIKDLVTVVGQNVGVKPTLKPTANTNANNDSNAELDALRQEIERLKTEINSNKLLLHKVAQEQIKLDSNTESPIIIESQTNQYNKPSKFSKEVSILKYDAVHLYHEGLAVVKLNGKAGYIDEKGKLVIPLKYDFANSFNNGRAKVKLNGTEFYIDKQGNPINISKKQSKSRKSFNDDGNVVLEVPWNTGGTLFGGLLDMITSPIRTTLGVTIDGVGASLIEKNKNNEDSENKIKYDVIHSYHEHLAVVRLNRKAGYIDKEGKLVIPLKYDFANSFNNGKAKVKLNGETFYIDKNGNRI